MIFLEFFTKIFGSHPSPTSYRIEMMLVFIPLTTWVSYKVIVPPESFLMITSSCHKTEDVESFPMVTDDLTELLDFSSVAII